MSVKRGKVNENTLSRVGRSTKVTSRKKETRLQRKGKEKKRKRDHRRKGKNVDNGH
ncbi:hypothetical protein ACFLZK_02455 [Patescibacteria group bacterium]